MATPFVLSSLFEKMLLKRRYASVLSLVCQSSHGQTFYDMLTQKAAKDFVIKVYCCTFAAGTNN